MDNLKGPTVAFATFSHFKSEVHRVWEALVLVGARRMTKAVRGLKFLHTAHFCRVSPEHLRRAGLAPTGRLEAGGLLFMSAYYGDADAYFRAFSDKVPETMDAVWNTSIGWTAAAPYSHLDAFINANRRVANCFFNAYPDTSQRMRASLTLRRGIDQLHRTAFSDENDQSFEDALHELAMRHWGNG